MRTQSGGDADVRVLHHSAEKRSLGVLVLFAHLPGVAAPALARLLQLHLDELSSETLHLLFHSGAGVEALDEGAHVARGLNSGEAGDASAHDQELGRRNLRSK